MFDLVEEPLNAVAFPVEHGAEAGAPSAGDFGGNVRCGASRRYAAAEPIGNRYFVGRLADSRGGGVPGNMGNVDPVEDRHQGAFPALEDCFRVTRLPPHAVLL